MASSEASLTWSTGMTIFRDALYDKIGNNEIYGKNAEISLSELLCNESDKVRVQINSLLGFLARKGEWQDNLLSADIIIEPLSSSSGKYRKICFYTERFPSRDLLEIIPADKVDCPIVENKNITDAVPSPLEAHLDLSNYNDEGNELNNASAKDHVLPSSATLLTCVGIETSNKNNYSSDKSKAWEILAEKIADIEESPDIYEHNKSGWVTMQVKSILSREQYDALRLGLRYDNYKNIEFDGKGYDKRIVYLKSNGRSKIPEKYISTEATLQSVLMADKLVLRQKQDIELSNQDIRRLSTKADEIIEKIDIDKLICENIDEYIKLFLPEINRAMKTNS